MKRIIKFRGWDEGNKIMHNDFQLIRSGEDGNDWIIFTSDKQTLKDKQHPLENPYFQQQLKIMQFTGLKDENDREVYEGDIVQKWHYNEKEWIATVKHVDYIDSQMDDYKGKDVSGFYLCNNDWDYPNEEFGNIEVIGNIYENPELL
jgi:uncharacterized phage protein (TIGR01671 family)